MCGAGRSDRAVDQSPIAIDPARQERCIFIVRLHDHTIALEGAEIFCKRQCHTRAAACIRRINDGILTQFRNVGNARSLLCPIIHRGSVPDQTSK